MYLKISTSSVNFTKSIEFFSTNLKNDEKIQNIEVIDAENLLILINKGIEIKAVIYNIKENQIIRHIDR